MDKTIRSIKTEILDIPIKRPHQFSAEKMYAKSFVIVRIETAEGLMGIGEGTTPGIWWSGESVETMQAVIEAHFKPLLLNQDPRNMGKILALMDRQVERNQFAKATVEMALYDLIGKINAVPVHQLLGGLYQESIPVRWALATGDVEEDAAEAKEKMETESYVNFKIKAGNIPPAQDAKRTADVAYLLRGHSTVGVDPNGSWDILTATRWMDRLNEAGVEFLEQPLPYWDIDGLARLTAMSKVPVMADESASTLQEVMQLAKKKAADIISLKIHKSGGMKSVVKIAGIAEAAGISCFGGTSLESSIGTAACLHAYCTIPNLDYGSELFGPVWLADDIVKEPVKYENGRIFVPKKPGLGVELDEEKVSRYRRKNT
jgi:muconate cycloisomerase